MLSHLKRRGLDTCELQTMEIRLAMSPFSRVREKRLTASALPSYRAMIKLEIFPYSKADGLVTESLTIRAIDT